MYSLRLFGGASIEGPDGPLTGRAAQRHRLALLALLATSPRGLTRDKLIAYLWPEKGTPRARHALSDSIYRIHEALDREAVLAAGDELRLVRDRLPSDVDDFRRALEAGEWERAVDVYAGPFMDGFHLPRSSTFERWLDGERERLGRRYGDALESLAEHRSERGDLKGAVEAWRRRAAHDRFDSRVAVRLMQALEDAGNRAGALRHARAHARLLEQEFGAEPDPDVDELAERLRAAPDPGSGPDPSAASAPAADGPRAAADGESEADRGPAAATGTAARPDGAFRGPDGSGRDRRGAESPGRKASREAPSRGRWSRRALVGIAVLAAAVGLWLAWEGGRSGGATPPVSASVAVLPFDDIGASEDDRHFTDGVTEEILANLARIGELRVIARASVMRYRDVDRSVPDIAEELGVGYVVEGSVRRDGERVRVTARLVDAGMNSQVWAESYDRRLEDIFAVQSDIATRVADALEAELGAEVAERIERSPTDDLEAYNLYLRGRYYWHRRTERDLRESARFFERAVERDSGYARAWAGLADAYAVMAFYDYLPPRTAYPRAKEAAERALAIDDGLAEAHASLGYVALYYDWDGARAEVAFRRAIELNPSYSVGHQWYANLLVATGRFEEAAREMNRAREVNPLSLIANGALGWVYHYAGRYDEAVRQCERALEMDPAWDLGHLWRGLALERLGRTGEAVSSLRRAMELSGGSGITRAALAHALAGAGRVGEARRLLQELTAAGEDGSYQPSFEIAKVHLALGDEEAALDRLERAYEERSHSMAFLEVDPQLAALRSRPRFRRLVERVGLE